MGCSKGHILANRGVKMTKKQMTAAEFDAILPGNTSRSVQGARLVLVDGSTFRSASESLKISISAIVQAIHRLEREPKK